MDITVNHKYFVVKLFLDSLGCAKIKCTKIHAQYCSTGSFVRKLFNMKNYCMKYFRHEIFAIYVNFYSLAIYVIIPNSPITKYDIQLNDLRRSKFL